MNHHQRRKELDLVANLGKRALILYQLNLKKEIILQILLKLQLLECIKMKISICMQEIYIKILFLLPKNQLLELDLLKQSKIIRFKRNLKLGEFHLKNQKLLQRKIKFKVWKILIKVILVQLRVDQWLMIKSYIIHLQVHHLKLVHLYPAILTKEKVQTTKNI